VLDAKTGAVLRTIHVGDNPRTVAFTPDGRHVWVSAEAGGNVTVIDVATDSVLRQFPIRDGKTKAVRIAFSPDARLAYLTEGAAQDQGRRARAQPSSPQVRPARAARITTRLVSSR